MAEQKRNTKPLTPASIASARPRAKPYEMSDAASGLRLNVSPTGVRSWRWYVKDKGTGKTRKITLGTFPSLSLGDARTKIEDLKEAHKTGHLADLVESRRARAAPDAPAGALTVAGFAPMFMQTIQRRRERPEQVQRVLDNDLIPALGHRPLASITTLDAARVVEDVVEGAGWREGKGASTYAGNVLQVVKQFFRVARSKGLVIVNPADTLDPDDLGIVHRVCDRFLSPKEIEQFWKALESPQGTTPTVRNALRLLLLTGVRSGELLLAEWSEIDLDEGKPEAQRKPTWTIPVEHQKLTKKQKEKGAKPFRVPLTPTTIEILRNLRAFADSIGSTYVLASFHVKADPVTGKRTDAALTEKSLNLAMRRLFTRGKPPLLTFEGERPTPHDLRRTVRTHLSKTLRVPPHVAEKCLNHSLGRVFSTYDQGDYLDDRRLALGAWDAYVERLVTGKGAEVVAIDVQAVRS